MFENVLQDDVLSLSFDGGQGGDNLALVFADFVCRQGIKSVAREAVQLGVVDEAELAVRDSFKGVVVGDRGGQFIQRQFRGVRRVTTCDGGQGVLRLNRRPVVFLRPEILRG